MSNDKFAMCLFWVFFAVATVYFSHITSVTTLSLGKVSRLIGKTSDNCLFSISEKMISFNKQYMAGPESNQRPLDPQSDSLSTLGD